MREWRGFSSRLGPETFLRQSVDIGNEVWLHTDMTTTKTHRVGAGFYRTEDGFEIAKGEDGTWFITWPGQRTPDSWASTKGEALAIIERNRA